MKKLILILFALLLCPAQKCHQEIEVGGEDIEFYTLEPGKYMYYETDKDYTLWQVDSVCNVEGIPGNFSGWIETAPVILNNGRSVPQYVFISNDSTAFIVTKRGSEYNFKKRVVRTLTE